MPVDCSILPQEMRETRQDFMLPTESLFLATASLDHRPDSVSPDYQVAFSYGPVAQGNLISGSAFRVWSVRHEEISPSSGTIYIRNANSGSYNAETTLFSYGNASTQGHVVEVDIAFGSDGRAVIAAERSGSGVWLYWFNGFTSQYQLDQISSRSKTPRIVHDIPEDPPNSDLLLFYVSKSVETVHYRQQRDGYGDEYSIPFPKFMHMSGSASGIFYDARMEGNFSGSGSGVLDGNPTSSMVSGTYNGTFYGFWSGSLTGSVSGGLVGDYSGTVELTESIYLEDVVKLQDSRVALFFTRHNAVDSTYQSGRFETVLFPIYPDIQLLDFGTTIVSISLYDSFYNNFDIDSVEVSASFYTGSLKDVLLYHSIFDVDSVEVSASFYTGSLRDVLLYHSIFDIDSVGVSASFQTSSNMYTALFQHYQFDIESVEVSASFVSGSLAIP